MNQFNKDIIAALSSDKDITLNEVLRRQIEVAANQFLQNELTTVLGYEPRDRLNKFQNACFPPYVRRIKRTIASKVITFYFLK